MNFLNQQNTFDRITQYPDGNIVITPSDHLIVSGKLYNDIPGNSANVVNITDIDTGSSYLKIDTTTSNELISFGAIPVVSFLNTTAASSTTVAAVSVAGGLGVARNAKIGSDLLVGGDQEIIGNLVINGTLTTPMMKISSVVTDSVIILGNTTSSIISTTGTVGSISGTGPWTITVTNMTDTTGLSNGSVIVATNGTGRLGGTCTVTSVINLTSITCIVSIGLDPTAGTVTNIGLGAATDLTATNGGILLRGDTNKTITWDYNTNNWKSNIGIMATGIDQTPIGANIASTGKFTTVRCTIENIIPTGTIAERISSTHGSIRYNTETKSYEGYADAAWAQFGTRLVPTAIKTSAYTAQVNDIVRVNTTASVVTIQLPVAPGDGSMIAVMDVHSTFGLHAVTLLPGAGATIESIAGLLLDIAGAYTTVTYIESTNNWKLAETPVGISVGTALAPSNVVVSDYTTTSFELVRTNSSSGSFNIYFPSAATNSDGDVIGMIDITNSCAAHPITLVAGAGTTIETNDNLIVDVLGTYVTFLYTASTANWKVQATTSGIDAVIPIDTLHSIAGAGTGDITIIIDFSFITDTHFNVTLPAGVTGATIKLNNISSRTTDMNYFKFDVIVSHVSELALSSSIVFKHNDTIAPKWSNGFVPDSTVTANSTDQWSFFTYDGGATLVGSLELVNIL